MTAKEHFIAHLLLVKIYWNDEQKRCKMVKAFYMMKSKSSSHMNRIITSRWYDIYKKEHSKTMQILQTGIENSQYGTMWITNGSENKKIKNIDSIPEGWYKGKIENNKIKVNLRKNIPICRKCVYLENKNKANLIYDDFKKSKYVFLKDYVKNSGYNRTTHNLNNSFRKYIDGYVSISGRKLPSSYS